MTEEIKSGIKEEESKENPPVKKSTESKSDDEVLQENLKELFEKESREERKANGRLVAVIVAFLVIFLAIYHAWFRKTGVIAGVLQGILVPAVIMLSYGGWVVILAKRDKRKRAMFEKHLEEVALKNKTEMEEKMKQKHAKRPSNETTSLHFENELSAKHKSGSSTNDSEGTLAGEHRKHRKHRNKRRLDGDNGSSSSGSSRHSSSHHATKDLRTKRPSIRQKLFRQNAASTSPVTPADGSGVPPPQVLTSKKKRLQRVDALSVPPMVRTSSAPN